MNTKLMELANEVKTRHGYKLAEQIAEIARDLHVYYVVSEEVLNRDSEEFTRIKEASLLTRIKWVFTGVLINE